MPQTINYTTFVGTPTSISELLAMKIFDNAKLELVRKEAKRTKRGIEIKITKKPVDVWQIIDHESLSNAYGMVWVEITPFGSEHTYQMIIPPHDFEDEELKDNEKLQAQLKEAEASANQAIKLRKAGRKPKAEDALFYYYVLEKIYDVASLEGSDAEDPQEAEDRPREDPNLGFKDEPEFEFFTGSRVWIFGKAIHNSDDTSCIKIPINRRLAELSNAVKKLGFNHAELIVLQDNCSCCT